MNVRVAAGARALRWLALLATAAACDKAAIEQPEDTAPSPNASILPAPLSSQAQPAAEVPPFPGAAASGATPDAPRSTVSDGGITIAQVLRSDEAPDDDPLTQRELTGVSLEGEWRYADPPTPTRGPEVNQSGIEAARKLTAPRLIVDLATVGRMRITFDSRAMPLARGAELRARGDRYGHAVVWPDGARYRVLPPGGVRTLLSEGRADAIPLVRPQSSGKLEGQRRLGLATKRWELSTRTGRMILEQARIPGAGEGGILLCRMLAELLAIDPSAAPCAFDDVPLRAQFNWPDGGTIAFEVTRLADKVDFSAGEMLFPPPLAQFVVGELPRPPMVLLSRDELAAFRTRALDAPLPRPAGTPDDGLLLHNGTDLARYAVVDGVPVAWVPPGTDAAVRGLLRGRYIVQWRSFLADVLDAAVPTDVPARSTVGAANGGTASERDR